jgi:peroxiredoxin
MDMNPRNRYIRTMSGSLRYWSFLLIAVLQQAPPPQVDNQSSFSSAALASPAGSNQFRFAVPFPKFEAKDTSGKTWRLDDLHGKFTLIYLWSTAEARLQDEYDQRLHVVTFLELRELQRFYDKVKDSRNIQVVTFCRDFESGDSVRAQDYMKENHYSFPVITDYVPVHQLFDVGRPWVLGANAPPSHFWLVNTEAKLADPVPWSFGRLLFELERDAGAK